MNPDCEYCGFKDGANVDHKCTVEGMQRKIEYLYCEMREQVAKARACAIEECAEIAESFTNKAFKVVSHDYEKFHNQKIAEAIRNKLEKE